MLAVDRAVAAGLTSEEARTRLDRFGRNELPPPQPPSALRRFGKQLVHLFALMLWAAAALALVAGLPQLCVAIVLVVLLNACFAFAQEARADRAAAQLRRLLPMQVTVRRDGRPTRVDAATVVDGDLLLLEAGDRIPADGVAVSVAGLLLDTSMLTGESAAAAASDADVLLAGTYVVEGEGAALVTATGPRTRLAQISRLTTGTAEPPTPLAQELARVVRTIGMLAIGIGLSFFGLAVALGNPASEGLVFGIGVAVALVPEALLPTMTLSLAWGAEQMSRRSVLVRSLDAVETLGSTTFICTDKTGTLTRNEMTVVQAWTPAGSAIADVPGYDPTARVVLTDPSAGDALAALAALAGGGALASGGHLQHGVDGTWQAHGDPMEVALDVFARRLGLDTDSLRSGPVTARFPFDPRRRRMSVVIDGTVVVKGAPDSVIPLCQHSGDAEAVVRAYTEQGLRVLAIAGRPIAGTVPASFDEAERDLELRGIVGLQDPPPSDARDALLSCRRAGIRVAMVTGDHPATAVAIAEAVGLARPGAPVVLGSDLPVDEHQLGALIDHDGAVVARVSPEDKLRIARALRARGQVVAMTGDGVNDGPALHEADIGVAMGQSGTDVAREAADLVLLDDRFSTIVAGIEQGRAAFLNVRRFLTYHLTDNVAELTPFVVWALSGGRIPLALSVLQVLALDIGTDTFSAVALGAEPPPTNVLDGPPATGRLLSRTVLRRAFGWLGPTEATIAMGAFAATFLGAGWRPGDPFPDGDLALSASGAAFVAVVLGQMTNAYACRSATKPVWSLPWRGNRLLLPAIAFSASMLAISLLVGPVHRALDQLAPTTTGWLVAAVAPLAIVLVDGVAKVRRRRRAEGARS
jgi:magnesium-transporting ATPase (P-type)